MFKPSGLSSVFCTFRLKPPSNVFLCLKASKYEDFLSWKKKTVWTEQGALACGQNTRSCELDACISLVTNIRGNRSFETKSGKQHLHTDNSSILSACLQFNLVFPIKKLSRFSAPTRVISGSSHLRGLLSAKFRPTPKVLHHDFSALNVIASTPAPLKLPFNSQCIHSVLQIEFVNF